MGGASNVFGECFNYGVVTMPRNYWQEIHCNRIGLGYHLLVMELGIENEREMLPVSLVPQVSWEAHWTV